MDTKIVKMGGRFGWVWSLWEGEQIIIGGRARTRERAEKAARKANRLTWCARCGKWAAGGGHRFCRSCLLWQLDQPINRTPYPTMMQGAGKPYSWAHKPSPFIGHTNGVQPGS